MATRLSFQPRHTNDKNEQLCPGVPVRLGRPPGQPTLAKVGETLVPTFRRRQLAFCQHAPGQDRRAKLSRKGNTIDRAPPVRGETKWLLNRASCQLAPQYACQRIPTANNNSKHWSAIANIKRLGIRGGGDGREPRLGNWRSCIKRREFSRDGPQNDFRQDCQSEKKPNDQGKHRLPASFPASRHHPQTPNPSAGYGGSDLPKARRIDRVLRDPCESVNS